MAGIEEMVRRAELDLGMREPNKIQAWYGTKVNTSGWGSNWAWCNAAVTYWAWMSGNQAAVTFGGYYQYTVTHAGAFKSRGLWHADVAGIKRGDIVFFDWAGSNNISAIDHVGIVTGTSGAKVLTIEGNTDNVCARRVRDASTIAGYGRPKYPVSVPKPSPRPTLPAYVTYPGVGWFKTLPNSPVVTAMGKRLVANGCGKYEVGPGPQWTDVDNASYAAWQRKCGFSGEDANGWPGKITWDRLKVPK